MSIEGQGHFSTIYFFQVLYVLCFTWPRYQVSVYRTIGPLVTIYGHDDHLGYVTSMMLTNIHFLVHEIFHTKNGSEWHSSFLRKLGLNFLYVHDFGPRSRNDLTFNTHKPS